MKYPIEESEYEFFHIKWVSIKYDREKCIAFIKEYESILKTKGKRGAVLYEKLISGVGEDLIKKLCNGDYEVCRRAMIEKSARDCAMDFLLYGQYSKENFKIISHLPIEDYKLVLRRCKELVEKFGEIKLEAEAIESKVPGM